MAGPAVRIIAAVAVAALSLGSSGCGRLPQRSSPGAVTVRLPPPRTAAPGFAFDDQRKAAAVELR